MWTPLVQPTNSLSRHSIKQPIDSRYIDAPSYIGSLPLEQRLRLTTTDCVRQSPCVTNHFLSPTTIVLGQLYVCSLIRITLAALPFARMVGKGRDRRIKSEMPGSSAGSSSRDGRSRYWDTVLNRDEGSSSRDARNLAARPFKCEFCAQEFNQKPHLNAHIRTVHQNVKPFRCEKCPRRFAKRFDRESHMNAVHLNERPHVCAICRTAFAKRFNLIRHEKQLHPEIHAPVKRPRQS